MSLQKIHLRKLLKIFYSSERKRISFIREDIRDGINKRLGENTSGGEFYVPFWSDAKDYIAGKSDLRKDTQIRINVNPRRKRLYPLLLKGFTKWWEEQREWKDEDFEFIPESITAKLFVTEVGCTIKIENILAIKFGSSNKIIYPYFSEDVPVSEEEARLGLWALNRALTNHKIEDIEILDVFRGISFTVKECPLRSNEEKIFIEKYKQILKKRHELEKEYQ
jgi:hypothetical protein